MAWIIIFDVCFIADTSSYNQDYTRVFR